MTFTLRRATPDDFCAISRLFAEMLQTIYHQEKAAGYREGELDRYFEEGESWICVAEVREKVVGFLAIEVHREQENYLYYDDFSVTAGCRGKGIGAALLNEGQRYARSIGIGMEVLHVEEMNAAARSFYERHGFGLLRADGTRLCMIRRFSDVF